MSSVVISGDTSGAITLAAPAVAGTNTATLPAATGTVMVSGNMPAFSAYLSGSDQTITTGTQTKLILNSEEWDTANCFDSTTNYRFTPTVAGYYQINATFRPSSSVTFTSALLTLYKNGSSYYRMYEQIQGLSATGYNMPFMSTTVYMNGSTDYLEIYGYIGGTGALTAQNAGTQYTTKFQGTLVRTA
jgi:hypothetical protein